MFKEVLLDGEFNGEGEFIIKSNYIVLLSEEVVSNIQQFAGGYGFHYGTRYGQGL